MKKENELLLKILKSSVENKKLINIKDKNINWKYLINSAVYNDVLTIIYSYIDSKEIESRIGNEVKNAVIKMRFEQINNARLLKEIVMGLRNENIEIVVLKGMALRKYYKLPENRIMGDIDILIKKEDMNKTEEFLKNMGYTPDEENHPIHKSFYCKDKTEIEVHWKLINNEEYYSGDVDEFEKTIWDTLEASDFNGVKINVLSLENTIIYLCMHMSVHVKYGGFQLSQLYDLAMVITNEYHNINWDKMLIRMEQYSIRRFFAATALFLHNELGVKIPQNVLQYSNKNDSDLLVKYLFIRKSEINEEEFRYYDTLCNYDKKEKCMKNTIIRSITFLFPSYNKLSERYSYAKKAGGLLLPIAWIHHILTAMWIKKCNILSIIKCMFISICFGHIREKTINEFKL